MSQKFCAVLGCEAEGYGWIDLSRHGQGNMRTWFCSHHYEVVDKCAAQYKEESEMRKDDESIKGTMALPFDLAVRALQVEGLE
jgi:hypothetical protein